uniref:Spc7 domain-containing protein n=1 Tax=Strongyloides venezuelensis TaxID=75913 RepID=A0A0K0F5C1_STRVS
MYDRKNSILKQTNDSSNSSLRTPENTIKRHVSFSSKRVVQHFDKTDLTIRFNTLMEEEIECSGLSGSLNSTKIPMSKERPMTEYGTPENSALEGLNTTFDVLATSPGNISIISTRTQNTPAMNATRSVFGPFDINTPRIEVLSDSETNDDMDISFARTPMKAYMEKSTPEVANNNIANMSVTSPEKLALEKENTISMSENNFPLSRDTSNAHQYSNNVKPSTSFKILPNSYIYRNSPAHVFGGSISATTDIPDNSTPFRRRSLSSTRSGRSNGLRRSLLEEMSFSVEGVITSPDKENLSNVFDVDNINESNCSQSSFIKLSSPARTCEIPPFTPITPVTNDFVNDNSLVNASVLGNNMKGNEMEDYQIHATSPNKDQRFSNNSCNSVDKDVQNINSSTGNISRNSTTLEDKFQSFINDSKVVSALENAKLIESFNEKNCDTMDGHPSLSSVKCSAKVPLQGDQCKTLDNISTINFEKSEQSKGKSIVEKNTGTLHTIVEEEETQLFDKTISIDEVMARSEELKNAYTDQMNVLEGTDTANQDHESDIFHETSGFSTDADISIWNRSDSVTQSNMFQNDCKEFGSSLLTKKVETDEQNNLSTTDVTMRTVGESLISSEFYDITRAKEGLDFINPVTSVIYNGNYKEFEANYQLKLAIAFVQSILYNESLCHPMLKDFVHGFEKSAELKNFMVKGETPINLDDLYDKVLDLENVGEIIDDLRQVNFDVYKTVADRMEVFFDTIYDIYFLLLDHLSVNQQKQIKYNDKVCHECFRICNEMIEIKKMDDEERRSLSDLLNYIVPKYNL